MRLAIADPPYLGRAARWYGDGRGSGRTRDDNARGRNGRKADFHPEAALWDTPEAHTDLIRRLSTDYDGWALAGAPDYLSLMIGAAPKHARIGVWHRANAMPGGGRVITTWEPVVYVIPEGHRDRATGPMVRDVLSAPVRHHGFLGSKPPEWTLWVLALLGHDPEADQVDDIFHGSGAVTVATDGLLPIPLSSR